MASVRTRPSRANAAPSGGGELGQTQQYAEGAEPISEQEQRQREFEAAMAEANARGPGYGVADDGAGGYKVVVTDQNLVREGTLGAIAPVGPAPELPTLPGNPRTAPAPVTSPQQAIGRYGASIPAFEGQVLAGRNLGATGGQSFGQFGLTGGSSAPPTATELGPAEVDRANIDRLLGNVSKATSGLMGLGQSDLRFSQGQAQLAQGLDQSQRQALALARSGSRRDIGANMARAQQLGAESSAQATQAAAGLRAQEEAAQQQIRLDAYKAAGDLGLNAGALELDVNRLNMDAATNFLNQMFARENLNLQLDQQEAERVTNFVRDMALIAKDYYQLSVQERQSVRDDLTNRYGVDQRTRVALEELEQQGKVNWEKVGADMLAGAVVGAAQVGTKKLLGG